MASTTKIAPTTAPFFFAIGGVTPELWDDGATLMDFETSTNSGRFMAKSASTALATIQLGASSNTADGRFLEYLYFSELNGPGSAAGVCNVQLTAPFYFATAVSDGFVPDGASVMDFGANTGRFMARSAATNLAEIQLLGLSDKADGRSVGYLTCGEYGGPGSAKATFGVPLFVQGQLSVYYGTPAVNRTLDLTAPNASLGLFNGNPGLTLINSAAPSGARVWREEAQNGALLFSAQGDTGANAPWMQVIRPAAAVTEIDFYAPVVFEDPITAPSANFNSCLVGGSPVLTEATGGGGGGGSAPLTTNLLSGDDGGGFADSGIDPDDVALLDGNNIFTGSVTTEGPFSAQTAIVQQLTVGINALIGGNATINGNLQTANFATTGATSGTVAGKTTIRTDLTNGIYAGSAINPPGADGGLYLCWDAGTAGVFFGNGTGGSMLDPGRLASTVASIDNEGNGTFSGRLTAPTAAFATSCTVNGSPVLTVATGGGGMVYPGAGVGVSTGSAWGTSINPANIPLLNAANTFTGNQTINGNLSPTRVLIGTSDTSDLLHIVSNGTPASSQILVETTGNLDGGCVNYKTPTNAWQTGAASSGAGAPLTNSWFVYDVTNNIPSFVLNSGSGNATFHGTVTGSAKNFRIPYPGGEPREMLNHSCLEGPEIAVFYRGEAVTAEGEAEIVLPRYFEALTMAQGRTVLLTQFFGEDTEAFAQLMASPVVDGKFRVRSNVAAQRFYWEVKAVRSDMTPLRVVTMEGDLLPATKPANGTPSVQPHKPEEEKGKNGQRNRRTH
jgi:hypothetical protein